MPRKKRLAILNQSLICIFRPLTAAPFGVRADVGLARGTGNLTKTGVSGVESSKRRVYAVLMQFTLLLLDPA